MLVKVRIYVPCGILPHPLPLFNVGGLSGHEVRASRSTLKRGVRGTGGDVSSFRLVYLWWRLGGFLRLLDRGRSMAS